MQWKQHLIDFMFKYSREFNSMSLISDVGLWQPDHLKILGLKSTQYFAFF